MVTWSMRQDVFIVLIFHQNHHLSWGLTKVFHLPTSNNMWDAKPHPQCLVCLSTVISKPNHPPWLLLGMLHILNWTVTFPPKANGCKAPFSNKSWKSKWQIDCLSVSSQITYANFSWSDAPIGQHNIIWQWLPTCIWLFQNSYCFLIYHCYR